MPSRYYPTCHLRFVSNNFKYFNLVDGLRLVSKELSSRNSRLEFKIPILLYLTFQVKLSRLTLKNFDGNLAFIGFIKNKLN